MFRLSLYPIADSFTLVIAAAVALVLLLFIFRVGKDRLTRRQRAGLVALRLVVIALVILAMLRPTLIYMQTKKQSATLVVMADDSRSMTVPDMVGGKTRFEAMQKAVADAAPALEKLARDFEVKAYAFDAEAAAADGRERQNRPARKAGRPANGHRQFARRRVAAGGGQAALGRGALERRRQRPLSAARSAAANRRRGLKNLGFPLYTFPFGQSRGLGQAQDIAVKDLLANPTVFVKNPI